MGGLVIRALGILTALALAFGLGFAASAALDDGPVRPNWWETTA